MSIQQILNETAICYLPSICKIIKSAESGFTHNQMYEYTLRKINEAYKPIADMNEKEIRNFEIDLFQDFIRKDWI